MTAILFKRPQNLVHELIYVFGLLFRALDDTIYSKELFPSTDILAINQRIKAVNVLDSERPEAKKRLLRVFKREERKFERIFGKISVSRRLNAKAGLEVTYQGWQKYLTESDVVPL